MIEAIMRNKTSSLDMYEYMRQITKTRTKRRYCRGTMRLSIFYSERLLSLKGFSLAMLPNTNAKSIAEEIWQEPHRTRIGLCIGHCHLHQSQTVATELATKSKAWNARLDSIRQFSATFVQLLCSMLQSEAHVQHRSTSFNIVQHRSTSFSTAGPGAEVGLPAHGASGCLKVLRCAKMCEGWEVTGRSGKPWTKDVAT